MKKPLVAITALFLLSACKKSIDDKGVATPMKLTNFSQQNFVHYELGKDILETDFLHNPNDNLDTRFNNIEYTITLALLEIYQNHNTTFDSLVSKVNDKQERFVQLFDAANAFPLLDSVLESMFLKRYPSEFTADWRTFVSENYKYDIAYIPILTFANLGNVDLELPASLATPFEIDEDKFPEFDDNVPMWYKTDGGTFLTTINEHQAATFANPILTINNATINDITAPSPFTPSLPMPVDPPPPVNLLMSCNLATHAHEGIFQHKFTLTERFETSGGKTEFTMAIVKVAAYDNVLSTPSKWVATSNINDYSKLVTKKIQKDDIGTEIMWPKEIFGPNQYENPQCFDFATAQSVSPRFGLAYFEYDWIRTKKKLLTVNNSQNVPQT
jgi:hypothetical protein